MAAVDRCGHGGILYGGSAYLQRERRCDGATGRRCEGPVRWCEGRVRGSDLRTVATGPSHVAPSSRRPHEVSALLDDLSLRRAAMDVREGARRNPSMRVGCGIEWHEEHSPFSSRQDIARDQRAHHPHRGTNTRAFDAEPAGIAMVRSLESRALLNELRDARGTLCHRDSTSPARAAAIPQPSSRRARRSPAAARAACGPASSDRSWR